MLNTGVFAPLGSETHAKATQNTKDPPTTKKRYNTVKHAHITAKTKHFKTAPVHTGPTKHHRDVKHRNKVMHSGKVHQNCL
jgi:hypothetical protein